MIRPNAEQKGRARAVLFQKLREARHALAGAAVGVDVDLEGELHSISRRASPT